MASIGEEKADASVCGSPARVTTIAGCGNTTGVDGDGALSVAINYHVMAFDKDDRFVLYCANGGSQQYKVMQLDLCEGVVAEVCTIPLSIQALAVNDEGTIFAASQTQIFCVSRTDGAQHAFAGSQTAGNVDATGDAARFSNICAVAFDGQQRLIVADGNKLRRVSQDTREVTSFCGDVQSGHVDGIATAARFNTICGVAFDHHDGCLYVADQKNHRIRRITPDLQVSTRAGDGQSRHLDGRATAASFDHPCGLAAVAGWVYVSDMNSNTIRCLSPTGDVTTVAGSPGLAGYKDNVGDKARIINPKHLAVNRQGAVVFSSSNPSGEYVLRSFMAEQHTVPPPGASTLIQDLAALIKEEGQVDPRTEAGGVADLTVLSADGTPTMALRGVLMLRSHYFRTMLDSGLKEGRSDTINLNHSAGAVRALILYLHTDVLEAPDEALVELLEMAEMFDLPRLKAMAAQEVYSRIRPENACVFLLAAAQQNAASLREASLVYIANHFASVRKHSSFEDLPKELLLELMMCI